MLPVTAGEVPSDRAIVVERFRAEGYEVVLAADGPEALGELDGRPIDLLLLDLKLPTRSGWDVFEQVTSANPLLPVIVITGKDKQSAMAMAAGVGALMEKPLDVSLLLKTIAELLVEHPEKRLKRLVGDDHSTRYFRPASSASPTTKRFKTSLSKKGPGHRVL